MKLQPVAIDGWTYVLIAFFGAWAAALSTDEAAKYIAPVCLFWMRSVCASLSASLLALKMFRSTAYAEALKAKDGSGQQPAPTIAKQQSQYIAPTAQP
jgi:hypothetical protein